MLALLVNDEVVFTGDTLFRGTVGGTLAPGHATFEDLKRSVMDVLMKLPPETVVYPGHTDATTIGQEWEGNAFVRLWRGLDEPANVEVTAFGRPATLLLRAPDYDGGTKCQVRYPDSGEEVVPGSQVVGD
jgi:glyoxylase-like metal-dependent hydrolase (beta-lactamase superfamily II)